MNPLINSLAGQIVSKGHLTVTDHAGQVRHYGDGSGNPVHLRFNTARAERAVALDPALKLGECYMQGEIDMVEGDIYALLELLFTNSGPYATATAPWLRILNRVRLALSRHSSPIGISRARRNVQHHYDLSGRLYDLFLDEDRQYSCAYYREPGMSLEAAQEAKKQHIAAKLLLDRPGLSVLDIGSGWGGLGLYLSRNFDADVTGITLSNEQLAHANQRILPREEHRVRFLLKDFRKLDDRFDRIVSVGMFEHVGKAAFDTYFAQCAKLLKKDGVMVLHAIGRLDVPSWTNPFIAKYIFPGGYIPSLSEVVPPIERSGLKITDMEILRLHYADTLRDWRGRFMARRDEAKALYDEAFCRMWEFYLAASESAFRWQNLIVFQIQLAHDIEAVPLTRDYITDADRHVTARIQPRRAG